MIPVSSGGDFTRSPVSYFISLTGPAQEGVEFFPEFGECLLEVPVLFVQSFVFGQAVFVGRTVEGYFLKIDLSVVGFDGLFEVVDVDKLDVKLVVEMLYVL